MVTKKVKKSNARLPLRLCMAAVFAMGLCMSSTFAQNKLPVVTQLFTYCDPALDTLHDAAFATIEFAAYASDSDGVVQRVEYYAYNADTLIDSIGDTIFCAYNNSVGSTYWWVPWNNVSVGTWVTWAKAFDDQGGVSISAPKTYIVSADGGMNIRNPYDTIRAIDFGGKWGLKVANYFMDTSAHGTMTGGGPDNMWLKFPLLNFTDGISSISAVYANDHGTNYNMNIFADSMNTTAISTIALNDQANWNFATATDNTVTSKSGVHSIYLNFKKARLKSVIFNPAHARPTVSLTAPSAGAIYTDGATITINANANSSGAITKVEFYHGSNLIGTDTSVPFSCSWDSTDKGAWGAGESINLSAKVYDQYGLITSSAGVDIIITK